MDNLLRLRCSRYRQTPCNLKRVNAHAERRELSTSVLGDCYLIPQLSNNKNQKWTFILCPYVCCYVTIRYFVLGHTLYNLRQNMFDVANIRKDFDTQKKKPIKFRKKAENSLIFQKNAVSLQA